MLYFFQKDRIFQHYRNNATVLSLTLWKGNPLMLWKWGQNKAWDEQTIHVLQVNSCVERNHQCILQFSIKWILPYWAASYFVGQVPNVSGTVHWNVLWWNGANFERTGIFTLHNELDWTGFLWSDTVIISL